MQLRTRFQRPVSKKGQVTIPAPIRKKLNLDKTRQTIFAIEDNQVLLQRPPLTLDDAYGAVGPIDLDFQKMRRVVHKEKAAKYEQKFHRGN